MLHIGNYHCWLMSFSLLTFLGACTSVSTDQHARSGNGVVRVYAFDGEGHLERQIWPRDTNKEGCHRLSRLRSVHRFAQKGFEYCQVFNSRTCEMGTEVSAVWGGKDYRIVDIDADEPQFKLYRGTNWLLDVEGNVQIGSWACYYPS